MGAHNDDDGGGGRDGRVVVVVVAMVILMMVIAVVRCTLSITEAPKFFQHAMTMTGLQVLSP
jgi:hypothetical protein